LRTTAAVLVDTDRPLEIVDLQIPELAPGQVLVEIAFSGVCHTQLLEARGRRGEDKFLPHCLGHEGSGTVSQIGSAVTKVKVGDRVILSWMKGGGHDVPGSKYDWDGKTVNSGAIATFGRSSVTSENRLTVVPDDISLKDAAMLGCAVPTGLGAVLNTARVQPGESLAVFGAGGIGLCAIAGASIAGCSTVIAVDMVPAKLEIALKMGATAVIDASNADVDAELAALCPVGLDHAIEATGRTQVMAQALRLVRPRGGSAVVVGNASFGERIEIDPQQFNQGKRLLGTWGGDNSPDSDFPRYCNFLRTGQLDLKSMQSDPYSLDEINAALDDLESGKVARPVIDMSIA
jgi:S-(hydroxymethyl)glutathione dehydrogenase/alcohol dehydrogenase